MVKIEVNKTHLTHIFDCLANLKKMALQHHKSIPEDSAREYSMLLKGNIESQKFASNYPRLGKWKDGESNASKFWLWYGDALKSISFNKIGKDSWFAGFGTGAGSASTVAGIKKSKPNKSVSDRPKFTSALSKDTLRMAGMADKNVYKQISGKTRAESQAIFRAAQATRNEERAAFKAVNPRAARRSDQEAAAHRNVMSEGVSRPSWFVPGMSANAYAAAIAAERGVHVSKSISFGHEPRKKKIILAEEP